MPLSQIMSWKRTTMHFCGLRVGEDTIFIYFIYLQRKVHARQRLYELCVSH